MASVIAGGAAVAIVMGAIFGTTLWGERRETLEHAQAQANNLAVIAERDIERNLELYSLSLQGIVEGWARPEIMSLPDRVRRTALFDRSISARYITSAVILDQHGRLILNLKDVGGAITDFADRPYFRSHHDSLDEDLHISEPFLSRVDGVTTHIALSRRLSAADGSFAGVAVLYLNVDYFRDLLRDLEIGSGGRTSIFGPHGRVYMSVPFAPKLTGEDRSASPIYRRLAQANHGSFIAESALDKVERLFVFRTVAGSNIKVLVALATSDIYAPWRHRVWPIGAAVAAFAALLVFLSGLLGRELQARLRAEDRLLILSNTDGLTGLVNRRALDRILAEEGSRATRASSGLGVLFADVDYFKHYNDSQGHPAGDAVLTAVAQVLAGVVQRPGDHAGRYGGEEFLAVLAQTDAEGARTLAEKLRLAVAALAIPHPRSPMGIVTVSVGVAAMSQGGFPDWKAVVRAADAALYGAKAAGRNAVNLYSPGE